VATETAPLQIDDLYAEELQVALLLDGPFRGKLVPINGPFELHVEDGAEYHVVPRGANDWHFPVYYRFAREQSGSPRHEGA